MEDAPHPSVDTYGFEWPADFDHEKYDEFMSKYLTVLSRRARKWDQLLNSKEGFRRSAKVKRYIRKGIPSTQRGEVWSLSGDAKQLREQNPDLYKNILKGPLKQEVIETINLDIPRTFPDNIHFRGTSTDSKRKPLFNVLLAFAHRNPQIGYCQGLNFIAGIMLLVTDNEETTFWLLQSLVEKILPDYYTKQMTGLLTDISVLEELIKSKVPKVHTHMLRMGVSWSMYVSKWFVCLFAEVLPIETVLRIWDCLFYEGSKILLRVAVTLVMRNEHKILAANNFVEITDVFKSLPSGILVTDCHWFLKAIFRTPGSFPRATIEKLRNSCRKRIEQQQEETKLMHERQKEKDAAERQAREEALKAQKEKEDQEAAAQANEEGAAAEDATRAATSLDGESNGAGERPSPTSPRDGSEKQLGETQASNESASSSASKASTVAAVSNTSGSEKSADETGSVIENVIEPAGKLPDSNDKEESAPPPQPVSPVSSIPANESNGTALLAKDDPESNVAS